MIRTGDTIHNQVTGETITFLATSADTDGEAVVIETVVQPDGVRRRGTRSPVPERALRGRRGNPRSEGRRQGEDAGARRRRDRRARPAHKFRNAGDEPVRFVCEVRPALQFESLLETMFELAADGKTNRKGMPNPLRLAVIAKAHFDTVRLPFPPDWMQAAGLAVGAPLGKLLGYEATYEGKDEQVPAVPAVA